MENDMRKLIDQVKNFGKSQINENKPKLQVGHKYQTRGGWTAFINTKINGNPQGWCTDPISGKEESFMGTWDENTGECLKRGEFTNKENTAPYDIINL